MNSDEIIANVGGPIKKATCTELLFEERCNIWDFPAGCRVKFLGERWAIGIKGDRLSQDGHILVEAGDEIEKLDSLFKSRKCTKMKRYLLVDCVYFAQGGVWGPSPRAASLTISSAQGRCDGIYLMTAHCSLQELDGSSADSKTHK